MLVGELTPFDALKCAVGCQEKVSKNLPSLLLDGCLDECIAVIRNVGCTLKTLHSYQSFSHNQAVAPLISRVSDIWQFLFKTLERSVVDLESLSHNDPLSSPQSSAAARSSICEKRLANVNVIEEVLSALKTHSTNSTDALMERLRQVRTDLESKRDQIDREILIELQRGLSQTLPEEKIWKNWKNWIGPLLFSTVFALIADYWKHSRNPEVGA